MSKKYRNLIKCIVVICCLILIFDLIFIIYQHFFKEKESVYFDSINAFEVLDNNSIIAVGSNSNNDKGYEKAKITLYDYNYNKIWETLYNKKYNSSFFNIKKDKDQFIAVGSYESSKQEHDDSVRSALIAKYSEDGKLLAEKSFQILGNSKFTNILVVDDGYLVIGQSVYEDMTLGMSKDGGAFLIKYDKNLNVIWQKNYGGSKSGIYNDFLIHDGFIYVVGKDSSRLGIISKYTLDGNIVSTNQYQLTDTLGFTGIATDGNFLYVVGSKKIKEDQNDYDTDALIVKYDFDLKYISENTYKGKGMERYNKIITDTNSNLVVVGQTGIYDQKKSTNKLNVFTYDGILAKYNSNLDQVLIEFYGNEEDDYLTDIKQNNKQYLISGYSTYDGSYLAKIIIYTTSGKLIETK